MHKLAKFAKALKRAGHIAIVTHVNPDGDALGSAFAMKAALAALGKEATVLLEKEVPERYAFLDSGVQTEGNPAAFDAVLALDCGSVNRLGLLKPFFLACPLRLVLDHHYADAPFGDIYRTEPEAAACCELVYELIIMLCKKVPQEALVPLYTGLSTDTGNFKFSNVTAKTFTVAAALVAAGVDLRAITRHLYDTVKLSKLAFNGAVAEKMQFYFGGRISVLVCYDSFLAEFGLLPEDVEELPNTLLNVEGVDVSVLIKSREGGGLKISLRCKENIDMAELAASFGGGGHACAAGFVTDETAEVITDKLVRIITEQLEAFDAHDGD